MNVNMIQRLHGMMSGVLLLRAFDKLSSVISDTVLPLGEIRDRAVGAVPALVVGLFCLVMGVRYARGACRSWSHWVVIAVGALAALASALMAAYFLLHNVNVRGHDMQVSMVAKHLAGIVFGVATIVLASALLRQTVDTDAEQPGGTVR